MFKENNRFLIKTPTGFESFKGICCKPVNILYRFEFADGEHIECSGGHKLLTDSGFLDAREINVKNTITNKKIKDISIKEGVFRVYEPVSVNNNQTYFTNSVVSHNCNFLGSTNTLIIGEKLATLVYKDAITEHSSAKIYELPVKESYDEDTGNLLTKDHKYVICVDVSEGKNLDYSAFSIIDISTMPYRQVAVYRNNAIPPMLFPSVIKSCAEFYNNAYVLVEINNNPQVASILIEDFGYENVMRVSSGNKRAQTMTLYSGKNIAQGLKMSPLVKRIGCATLKTLVENDKFVVNDFETISELTTFVQEGPSYKAEEGCNDDLAMTLVIFGWLATQKMFKEMVEHDVRKQLQLEHFDIREEDQLPTMQVDDGLQFEHFVEGGAVWVESAHPDAYGTMIKKMLDF